MARWWKKISTAPEAVVEKTEEDGSKWVIHPCLKCTHLAWKQICACIIHNTPFCCASATGPNCKATFQKSKQKFTNEKHVLLESVFKKPVFLCIIPENAHLRNIAT